MGKLRRYAPAVDLVGDEPLPEGPRIDKAQFCPVIEAHDHLGVESHRRALRTAQVEQLPCHAEVDDQHRAVVERQDEELAAPAGLDEHAAVQARNELGGRLAPHGPAPEHLHLADPPADDGSLEPAPDCLDLGKLGHLGGGGLRSGETR